MAILGLLAVPLFGQQADWHVDASGYLWFPGLHGNLNAFDRNLGFKASAADLLSHFGLGFMGFVGAEYKRLVLTSDFIGLSLKVTNTRDLRLPAAPQVSTEVKFRDIMFTQKVGFRVIDDARIKIDGLTGFRFWHLGTTLTTTPSPSGNNPYASQNWADPLVGARIEVPLSPKVAATIAGDVGGWGAGSELEYQMAGLLTYKLKPKWALSAGWRYLYVDYSGRNQFSTQMAESGVILGVTYALKGPR